MGTPNVVQRMRGSKVLGTVVGAVAAVLLGTALTIFVLNMKASFVEVNGSCGSSRGSCSEGWGKLFAISFIPLFVLVPLAVWGVIAAGRKIGCAAGTVLLLIGVYPGVLVFDWGHGKTFDIAWTVSRASGERDTQGVWFTDKAAIRVRIDGVFAHDHSTGGVLWTFDIPRTDTLCAMSRSVDSGVGVIAYAPESKTCNKFVGVDLATGKPRWTVDLPLTEYADTRQADEAVALGGGTALIRGDTGRKLTAVSLTDGSVRWKAAPSSDVCRFDKIVGGPDQIVAVHRCSTGLPEIVAFDPATGKERLRTRVVSDFEQANADPYSASPILFKVNEAGARGRKMIQTVDASGRVVIVYTASDDHDMTVGPSGFSGAPLRNFVVVGDVLVGPARIKFDDALAAYRLSDGKRLWLTKLDHGLETLAVDGDKIIVLSDDAATPDLYSVDVKTGTRTRLGGFVTDDLAFRNALHAADGRYTLVAEAPKSDDHVLIGLR